MCARSSWETSDRRGELGARSVQNARGLPWPNKFESAIMTRSALFDPTGYALRIPVARSNATNSSFSPERPLWIKELAVTWSMLIRSPSATKRTTLYRLRLCFRNATETRQTSHSSRSFGHVGASGARQWLQHEGRAWVQAGLVRRLPQPLPPAEGDRQLLCWSANLFAGTRDMNCSTLAGDVFAFEQAAPVCPAPSLSLVTLSPLVSVMHHRFWTVRGCHRGCQRQGHGCSDQLSKSRCVPPVSKRRGNTAGRPLGK